MRKKLGYVIATDVGWWNNDGKERRIPLWIVNNHGRYGLFFKWNYSYLIDGDYNIRNGTHFTLSPCGFETRVYGCIWTKYKQYKKQIENIEQLPKYIETLKNGKWKNIRFEITKNIKDILLEFAVENL